MNDFEMLITEVFTLSDNTTVFVGSMTTAVGSIGPCQCDLVFDGSVIASFPADGEMILKNKTSSNRAISTTHPLKGSLLDTKNGRCILRGTHLRRVASP